MIINIDTIMNRLKERRRVFVSEADFQLEFAWVIKELYPNYDIRLEYCPAFDRRMHIDILVITDRGWIPIELKYKTKGCTIIDNAETFVLANHSAKDVNCYAYLKDIQRIEQIREKAKTFAEGYAVMLTNELSYLKPPQKQDCVYTQFSIHNGAEKIETLRWGANASAGTTRGHESPITFSDRYVMNWKPYSVLNDTSAGTFCYLVNRIGS
ncbi:MAG: hypothetical protein E7520_01770 [Ruminococcaceae bacterium]|nr:hypothetical protein [Oscillospiraceae bacterium]